MMAKNQAKTTPRSHTAGTMGTMGRRITIIVPSPTTLLHQMARVDAKRGIASLCLGGGNAVSMLVERD